MNPHDRKGLLRPGIGSNSSGNRIVSNANNIHYIRNILRIRKKNKYKYLLEPFSLLFSKLL